MFLELKCIWKLNQFCFVNTLNVKTEGEFKLCLPIYCKFVLKMAVEMHGKVEWAAFYQGQSKVTYT